jgi:cytoskeleton protein RodZ
MLTPKKNGFEEDFLSPALPRPTGEPARAWGRKPLSHVLWQQRESRKLSLQEVARLTRIPVKYLCLLEEVGDERLLAEPLSLIPALRRYAAFLNLSPDGAVAQFIAELEKLSPVEGEASGGAPPTQLLTHGPQPPSRALPRTLLLLFTLGLAPFVGYYSVRTWVQRANTDTLASVPFPSAATPAPQSEAPPPASSPGPSASPVDMGQSPPSALPPVESPPIAATPPAEPLNSASHHLRVQATAWTWLHVAIDEQPKKRLFLRPGQSLEWTAERGFTLSLGNAGGVKLTLDGQELSPVGKAGQMALNVRLPSQRGS